MNFNHYQVLGLRRNASTDEIKKAYKTLAKKYHPDMNPGNAFYEEHFKKINLAHEVLSDHVKRQQYDHKLYLAEHPYAYTTTQKQQARPRPANYNRKPQVPQYTIDLSSKQIFAIVAFFAVMFIGGYLFYTFMNHYSSNQHYEMGLGCEQRGDYTGAIYYYHQALDMDKTNYKVHKQLAYCLFNNSDSYLESYLEASFLLSAAIKHDIGDKDSLLYTLSQCYIFIDEYDKALITLNQIKKDFNDSTLILKGECLLKNKEWNKALACYEQYLKKHPQSDLCLQKIAYTHYKNIEYEKAIEYINQAILLDASNGAHYYIRGLVAIGEHDTLTACHYFNTSLDLNYETSERAINAFCK